MRAKVVFSNCQNSSEFIFSSKKISNQKLSTPIFCILYFKA